MAGFWMFNGLLSAFILEAGMVALKSNAISVFEFILLLLVSATTETKPNNRETLQKVFLT